MIYDLAMIAVLLVTIALGAYRGLAWQLASLASIVVGYSAALRFAGDVAPLIDIEPPWNWVVAMVAVFAAGSLAVWLVFRLVSGFIDRLSLKEFDKQMGGLAGAAKGVLLCLAITFFAVTLHERSRALVLESKSGWYMALLIDRADPLLPENLHAIIGPYLHQLEKALDARGDPDRPAEDYHGQSGLPASIPSTQLTAPPAEEISSEARAVTQNLPKEYQRAILAEYIIEPPDILRIDVMKVRPKAAYQIEPFDLLQVIAEGAPDQFPIANNFSVEPEGTVNLGRRYGRVKLSGLSVEEATAAIDGHLGSHLERPQVSVSLYESAGIQQIVGERLVGPDGTVNLGSYGKVYVTGMTVEESIAAIEERLSKKLENPQVVVDVLAYNSEVYYVILDGAGLGDAVFRFPSTGIETVQNALSQINGLDLTSKLIWVERPGRSSEGGGEDHVLPVDIQTEFPLLPGDRVFVAEDKNVSRGAIDARPTRIDGAVLRGEVRK